MVIHPIVVETLKSTNVKHMAALEKKPEDIPKS